MMTPHDLGSDELASRPILVTDHPFDDLGPADPDALILGSPTNSVPYGLGGSPALGPKSVQEWTGTSWRVVEVIGLPDGFEARPLDAATAPGTYPGERVLAACVPVA